jgi:sigma-B regulation protein RsbU (phosphoserine phosphatase)
MSQPLKRVEAYVYRRLGRVPPSGKLHRLAFWLLAVYLLLGVGRLLPGVNQALAGLSFLVLCALIVCSVPLFWRWVVRRLMWKVSNRLVVTYLLVGLTPIVLFATLALAAAYILSGQFATFAATSEINRELAHIESANRAFSAHLARELKENPQAQTMTLPEFDDDSASLGHSKLEVAAFLDGKPLSLQTTPPMRPDMPGLPPWLRGSFRGVVVAHGGFFLRAAESRAVDGKTLVTITTLPLAVGNLNQIASGLGTVTLVPGLGMEEDDAEASDLEKGIVRQLDTGQGGGHGHPPGPPPGAPSAGKAGGASAPRKPGFHYQAGRPAGGGPVDIQINGQSIGAQSAGGRGVNGPPNRPLAITGGYLPAPLHFFDITVYFVAPLQTVLWRTGEQHDALIHVNSRPSLLYERLFITSLQVAGFIQDTLIGIAVFFAVLELIAFIMAVRLNQTITNSISDLYVATQEIDEGNLGHRIAVKRQDQLAALSVSFNEMTASLEELLQEQREKERLQNELQIAHEVQNNLFPRQDVALSMLDLHGVCRPARSVSGDYYDFLVFGPSTLGLALGDISGKGISAALLMATLHSAVRAYQFAGEELITVGTDALLSPSFQMVKNGLQEINCGEIFESPGRVLALLNRHLYRSTPPEKYATLFLAHYEGTQSRMTYSNGGQLPPLVLRADHGVTRLDAGGTVVGLMDGMSYDEGTVHLRSGDIVIAYSDGVTEPENEFGDFGEERLLEVVGRNRHLPLAAISDLVMQALRSWIGTQEQPDDITLVLARQR